MQYILCGISVILLCSAVVITIRAKSIKAMVICLACLAVGEFFAILGIIASVQKLGGIAGVVRTLAALIG